MRNHYNGEHRLQWMTHLCFATTNKTEKLFTLQGCAIEDYSTTSWGLEWEKQDRKAHAA